MIVGHSERRQYFGETDETVLKRTLAALEAGLTPDRVRGRAVWRSANRARPKRCWWCNSGRALAANLGTVRRIVIAYEPVWAIGTGKTATPEIAADAHRLLRGQVRAHYGQRRRTPCASCTAAA